MDKEEQANSAQQSDQRFLSVLQDLSNIKESFVVQRFHWYEQHSHRQMVFFRISGALIVILSVSIPFLATLEGYWRIIVLPIVALTVAGLTGLSSFFRWDNEWKRFRQAQYSYKHMLLRWELRIIEAKHEVDVQKAIELAFQATEQLLEEAEVTTNIVVEEIFKNVQEPRIQQR